MAPSDSPDFEFDISDLEVEGKNAPASEQGESMPRDSEQKPRQPVQNEADTSSMGSFEDDGDETLAGFAIDDMPDVSSSQAAPQQAPQDPAAADEAPVTRIEPDQPAKPSRVLGADDLGADVFAEMDGDGASMSFEDVIDDLMEEVDEFEAGGFVELDEEEAKSSPDEGDGSLFKLEDPDDSLVHGIDPNAEPEEAPQASAPAFPSPPMDFEIPADPEPDEDAASDEKPEPQSVEPEAEDSRAPAGQTTPVTEIPADRDVPQSAAESLSPSREDMPEQEERRPGQASDDANREIPADPAQAEVGESSEVDAAPKGIDGREHVLFAAEEEASDESAPEAELETDSENAPETIEAAGSPDSEVPAESIDSQNSEDLISDEIVEGEPAELEDDASIGAAPETKIDAETAADDSPETMSEAEVEQEADAETVEDPETIAEASESEETESVEPPQPAAPELSVLDDDDEDLSDLVAAALEEEEEAIPVAEDEANDGEADSEIEAQTPAEPSADLVEEEDDDLSDLISAAQEEEELEADSGEATAEAVEEEISEDDALETAEPAESEPVAEAPGLQVIDEEEEEISEDAAEPAVPGLAILDDDEAVAEESDSGEMPEVPGLVEVSEEEELLAEEESEEEEAVAVIPSAEDLLKQAGSLLSEEGKKPAENASDLLNEIEIEEDDEEEVIAMPAPAALIADASEFDEDDEDVITMPDPASLISDASQDEEDADSKSGNVADRAGDLPPPPPAPVEIIDEEPLEEDNQEAVDDEEVVTLPGLAEINESAEASGEEPQSESELEDPFSAEISLDDFDEDLEAFDDLDGDGQADGESGEESSGAEVAAAGAEAAVAQVIQMPKPSLLWRITHSMAVAAGLVLIGLASVLAVWKQQIVEYIDGRDLDGSALVQEIREIGKHALSEFDENGLYRMQWVESEVKRVSENEIRLHALVGAQLRENLYEPVLESELEGDLFFDETELMESLALAHERYPEEIGRFPDKPWHSLYRLATPKDELLPLKVTYAVTRESEDTDWELSRIKVSGYREELKWPDGQPRQAFGDHAYDIDSAEFKELEASYREDAAAFIAAVAKHTSKEEEALIALQRENENQRHRVRMALAEGSYFDGVAIIGEDAAKSRDVQLVITEVRDEGAFVKGVVRTGAGEEESSKLFVGNLDFEKTFSGREQGVLNLTTVSLDIGDARNTEAPFFDPKSVTRMRLKADGFRLEGDSRDLSLRLTRSM